MTSPDPAVASAPPSAPAGRARPVVVVTMAIAQFGLFVGLLAPVTVSLALKTQTLVPGDDAAAVNGNVLAAAALFALVGNPVFGRLSDLTTSRYGRRRPWMAGGAVVFVGAMLIVALAGSVPVMLIGWCLAQLAGNAILAPLLATIADQVPPQQRASVSANVGVMQNVGILAAAYIAAWFVDNMVALFVVPGVLALVLVGVFCAVVPDKPITERPETGGWLALLRTFWVNPVRYPDFGWAWLSRFLVFLAYFLFISFRIFYLQERIGLEPAHAASTLGLGALVFTIGLVITAKAGGWLSDRTGRRKVFVVVSILLLAIAFALLGVVTTIPGFLLVEAVMGIGYGVYWSVDTALTVDVLPDRENTAKDLGVMNIANALPQSLAAALGGILLVIGTGGPATNYTALFVGAGVIGVLGALAILPIRSVR
ncbi:MFS transporter [Amycolatopsis sp. RTGN1]|uniref:MFS transporter n=1 Tax=Amycolatopsis ponsaeliensis TaxID=2992142 RepID=UPI00254A081F|nr:MFS transporter [Amycolatopsis sp. RTGN1]